MLLDTNIIIYNAHPEYADLRRFLRGRRIYASAISKVEALGFRKITLVDKQSLTLFFRSAAVLPVSSEIIERAITLRQQRKMSLGDALIGATALAYGLPLATHNVRDFDWIDGLSIIDPLTA